MQKINVIVAILTGMLMVGFLMPMNATAGPKKAKGHGKFKAKKHGPPPHAPAHGYKHKLADGTALSFDTGLGVYAIDGKPGFYYRNGLYIKVSNGVWHVSTALDGTWRASKKDEVPQKLKEAKAKKMATEAKVKTHKVKGKK